MDLSRFKALTFDCYGTLIDWETGIAEALQPLLHRHGLKIAGSQVVELYARFEAEAENGPYRSYRAVLGDTVMRLGYALRFEPTEADRDALANSIADWAPFPDTVRAVESLAERYRLAILSNVDDDLFALTARKLPPLFETAVTAEQVGSYKPAPAHFREAIRRLGVPERSILHLAQSLYHDIAPAQSMGLATVWVNRRSAWGGSGATLRASVTPDLEVPDLRELVSLSSASGSAMDNG